VDIPIVVLFLIFINISVGIFSLVGMLYGGLFAIFFVLYNKAVMKEEVSRVMAIFYTNPIFILLLAVAFLGDGLSVLKCAGIILLVLSAVLVSYKKMKGRMRLSLYAVELMMVFSFIWAAGQVLSKWAFNFTDYLSFLFWSTVGGIVAGSSLLAFRSVRRDFFEDVKRMGRVGWSLRGIGVATYYGGIISFYAAISIGSVSLVGAIPSVQPLLVFLYSLFLSIFFPNIIKEDISRRTIIMKLLAVVFIFAGSWLIVVM
jgi:drug/metabolite transporter (DMT)-like permease